MMGTTPSIRIKGMSQKRYLFLWDPKSRNYCYEPENQKEVDDIFRTQGKLYKTIFFSALLEEPTKPVKKAAKKKKTQPVAEALAVSQYSLMVDISFLALKDQLASMLGADESADLPPVDQNRLGICINQAYRECYNPIDGRRPMWAQKQFTLNFLKEQAGADLPTEVTSVDKIPQLVGEGPLSPMTGPEAEIRIRSIFAFDFRSPSGRGLNFPHYKDNEPEIDRPIWYYLDNRDHGTDTKVVPRFYLYPIPDKAYTVELYGNIIPSSLELDTDEPRIPSDLVWDIMFPLAQAKLLSDPRYNGDNKELLLRMAEEARKRLRLLVSPQKHKGSLRITRRPGW